ncbi:hypothetical protein [Candidatus Thiodiazotropha sp. CDECU1]|uniref:hypothetical protein n=1 Tax=Candidatus Thiodiazotropha sp. CDECU1 TaxID=3065865 RepID=UPI00292D1E33|nr:hypothetical protein [Candidatus Thiodiazotropha sp. CDECU1]
MKQLNNDEVCEAIRSQYGYTAEGCCGGPAPEDADACCVADAEAKATGDDGCGCSAAPSSDNNSAQGECCSATALLMDETS